MVHKALAPVPCVAQGLKIKVVIINHMMSSLLSCRCSGVPCSPSKKDIKVLTLCQSASVLALSGKALHRDSKQPCVDVRCSNCAEV